MLRNGDAVPLSEINKTVDAEAYALAILVALIGLPFLIEWVTR